MQRDQTDRKVDVMATAKDWMCNNLPLSAQVFIPFLIICALGMLVASVVSSIGKRAAGSLSTDDQIQILPAATSKREKLLYKKICDKRDFHLSKSRELDTIDVANAFGHAASALALDFAAVSLASGLGIHMEAKSEIRHAFQQLRQKIHVSHQTASASPADMDGPSRAIRSRKVSRRIADHASDVE